ncbi:39S ribosomal protein L40, mitochondrial [Ornithorhynchus anatinus]|uniref:39S ribosomal protein L40, mitochondrial n=1 Tax=Ornithorhynchus anatinus TaxID=9258 RepID=UPI0010A871C5|nr:39S ribosomal protein L40, mitochondrial [Ornithorhynchus anatinus]
MAGAAAALLGAARGLFPPRHLPVRENHWQTSLLALRAALPLRAEPMKKKKRVDPKKDQAVRDRLKKKLRRMERAAQELVPIEDFITPVRYTDGDRKRAAVTLSEEEEERRAHLMKLWAAYKQKEHEAERATVRALLASQEEALRELLLEAPALHRAALARDPHLFPFDREGPRHSPPIPGYEAPEGKYKDVTRVYTQVETKR